MARRSPHEHLKPEIFRWFGAGLKPSQVREKYPDIAKTTIYDWHKEWRYVDNSGTVQDDSGIAAKPVTVEVVGESVKSTPAIAHRKNPPIKALPTKKSDYWRVRTEAVNMATDDEVRPYVKVQAIAAVCKLLELERDLPQHILEQQTEQSVSDERDRHREGSTADLAREYKEAMD